LTVGGRIIAKKQASISQLTSLNLMGGTSQGSEPGIETLAATMLALLR
jgi:hypothetical protein